jgi:adenylate cyclase, class 2
MAGPWEVEQKYVVREADTLLHRLSQQAAVELRTEEHVDIYMQHPCRDFRATDEAFRLRQFNSQACVTYKGKRLPGKVKTRPEIELAIQLTEIPQWLEMMQHLGFKPLPEVRKTRRVFSIAAEGAAPFTVAMDEVSQLGSFAEIELLVVEESLLDPARERIESLAQSLLLTEIQPRSYLSLLLLKLGIE